MMRPCLSFLRQRARAPSTIRTTMPSVAGTRWRKKSGAIIASPGEKSGLAMKIGIVAGEPSGDFLGAALIEEMRQRRPDLRVAGIGGPNLRKAGCDILFPMEKLAVMGLVEVLGKVRELKALRARLAEHFIGERPDVFIGVDSPDFNLGLERALRNSGIKTVHYVCPTVWAWRPWRVRTIRRAAHLVLCVFPFEAEFLRRRGIRAVYAGHPLAAQVEMEPDAARARRRLGLPPDCPVVAVLPGSRNAELERLAGPFLDTAAWLAARHDRARFITNAVNDGAERHLRAAAKSRDLQLKIVKDSIGDTLAAAGVALLASGTVTLEAMLYKTPMVVAYRMHGLSYRVVRALVNVKYVSLPNLLAGERLAPEYFQSDCRAEVLGPALQYWLDHPDEAQSLARRFSDLHTSLRTAEDSAAQAVLNLVDT